MKILLAHLPLAMAATLSIAAAAPAPAPPASAADILQRAKQEIAGMPQEWKQDPPGNEKVLSSTLQQRLDRSFAAAHAAVRPKWYQPARIEELPPVGDGAVRVYRIVTGVVTYCMTYRRDGLGPTYSLCD